MEIRAGINVSAQGNVEGIFHLVVPTAGSTHHATNMQGNRKEKEKKTLKQKI